MRVLQPSWGLCLKLWWAMTWRFALIAVLAGICVGLVVGGYGAATGMDQAATQKIAGPLGAVCGLIVSVRVLRGMMQKGFGSMRLVVVDRYDT